jgi:UDP-N-acetylmuramoyl-L-alanyl-D-glutamate--2,6-diaminopimelate ligase
LPIEVAQIIVGDTRQALSPIAASYYRDPSQELTVIGITGTDGKTTTSYILDHIFGRPGR